jgi:glycosyltransferase involved in cell wall biosynthesis
MAKELKRSNNFKAKRNSKICLITDYFEEGRGGYILNRNLIQVFGSLFNGKNNVLVINSNFRFYSNSIIFRLVRVMIIELSNTFRLIKSSKETRMVFINFGVSRFLPMLASRMLHKKTVYMVSGLAGSELRNVHKMLYKQSFLGLGSTLFPSVLSRFERLNYRLADVIVAESPFLAAQINSGMRLSKPVVNGALFVDIQVFLPRIDFCQKEEVVGYFGALAEHKGLINLIEAVPLIMKQNCNVRFVIGGGPESAIPEIKERLQELAGGNSQRVTLIGKISHVQMPKYLNEMKLVVLPSFGEGLPNIILEAMACGTPVLATPCGGTPEIIKDGETGFIMEDNSPQCIARNVVRALNASNLEEIARNARSLIEKEYTYIVAVERYRDILIRLYRKHQ